MTEDRVGALVDLEIAKVNLAMTEHLEGVKGMGIGIAMSTAGHPGLTEKHERKVKAIAARGSKALKE
jgi:hypothetical protein